MNYKDYKERNDDLDSSYNTFLDYEAFAKDISQSMFGSFNTIILKD